MKTLALDIGGVCLRLTPERAFQGFGLEPKAPMPPAFDKLYNDYSNGVIGTWRFAKGIQDLTGLSLAKIQSIWNAFLGPEIPETTALLEQLWAVGWRIVFFSDTQPWHIEGLRDILSYSKRISEAVYSCDVGAQKPSAMMYEAFEERYGVPDLYLDDRECNIKGALARGWNAHVYSVPFTLPIKP